MLQQWISIQRGESAVLRALKSLPDEYVVLSDLVLPEGRVDLDYVVAGPNGLFALEAKEGPVDVRCKGHDWFVDRKRIPSPGRLATIKADALRKSLVSMTYDGEKKIPAVCAVLVFTHPESTVDVREPAVPAMRLEELAAFIVHYKVAELSPESRPAVVQHLVSFQSGRKMRRGFFGFRLRRAPKFSPSPAVVGGR
ncbi:MAG TPA: nuclease-related domain-containing protein [Candidatus Binatia bacterium]